MNKSFPTRGLSEREIRDYFVSVSTEKYGDTFDYSKIEKVHSGRSSIKIGCPIHGNIETTFERHIYSTWGCKECGEQECRDNKRLKFSEFIERLENIESYKGFKVLSRNFKERQIKKEKVFVQTEFGICKIGVVSLLQGNMPDIKTAIIKDTFANNKYRKVHGYNQYDFSKSKYRGAQKYTYAICRKHGEFRSKPNWLLNGQGCKDCWEERRGDGVRSNTEEFIKKAIKRLGTDKSIYDKSVYKTAKTKLKIRCDVHNKYYNITPNDHLTGYGCPDCGVENGGFSKSDYLKLAKGRDTNVYVIYCCTENEEFYKIGKTFQGLKKRYGSVYNDILVYEEVYTKTYTPSVAFDKEVEIHREFHKYKFRPESAFAGHTECYNLNIPMDKVIEQLNLS